MANERQFRPTTKLIATRNVKEYRETIPAWVTADDVVLELGCEWGTTTVLVAPHCQEIIGTDISAECIEEARRRHPHLRFWTRSTCRLRCGSARGSRRST